ncbi:MAG: hypothetical protein KDA85_05105 [Planctomycetaceae bacterium]|nr:hypothetical protein [Planctomycetaceae bacterium]
MATLQPRPAKQSRRILPVLRVALAAPEVFCLTIVSINVVALATTVAVVSNSESEALAIFPLVAVAIAAN